LLSIHLKSFPSKKSAKENIHEPKVANALQAENLRAQEN
jgi:hypothetical protein